MKWLVGLDLARSSTGAVQFGRWVREGFGDDVMALHAMEVPSAATPEWTDAIGLKLRDMLQDLLQELGAPDMFVDLAESTDTDKTLEEVRADTGRDAIVIGRRAATDEAALIRLGRVARRAVRNAKGPVVVCPPELDMTKLDGPLILATDGSGRTTSGALEFVRRLSKEWGRPWIVCHVAAQVDEYASAYFLNSASLDSARKALHESGQRTLNAYLETLPEAPAESVLLQGAPDRELIRLARQRRAGMLVAGSRRLAGAERLFSSSIGSALAAHAGCPVAIVPPSQA